jgi:hypothetical protein
MRTGILTFSLTVALISGCNKSAAESNNDSTASAAMATHTAGKTKFRWMAAKIVSRM